MSAIIRAQNGYLIAIRAKEGVTPGVITVDGLSSQTTGVLFTSFSQTDSVAHQVSQTIGGPEYIFVFGDMLQDLSIGLVMYPRGCESNANSVLAAWKFYAEKRLRPGAVPIVNLTFAGINLRGLVVGFRANADTSGGAQVVHGNLILKGWAVTESNAPTGAGAPRPSAGNNLATGAGAGERRPTINPNQRVDSSGNVTTVWEDSDAGARRAKLATVTGVITGGGYPAVTSTSANRGTGGGYPAVPLLAVGRSFMEGARNPLGGGK